jgi:hypothetical protein
MTTSEDHHRQRAERVVEDWKRKRGGLPYLSPSACQVLTDLIADALIELDNDLWIEPGPER